jgi:hypothetical protein
MIRFLIPVFAVSLLFSCCKSNEKAYQAAFEKMKEKDAELLKQEEATMLMDSSEVLIKRTSTVNVKITESVSVVEGDVKDLSKFNIVIKNFINRTNAKSLFERMKEEGHKAVLVKNDKNEYRVVVTSCKYVVDAEKFATEYKKTWPDTWVLVRY